MTSDVEQVEGEATGTPEQIAAARGRMMAGVGEVMGAMGELSQMGVDPVECLRESIRGGISDDEWDTVPAPLRMMFG